MCREVLQPAASLCGNAADAAKINKVCRTCLILAGLENGIKFIFYANSLMTDLLSKSGFIEAEMKQGSIHTYSTWLYYHG